MSTDRSWEDCPQIREEEYLLFGREAPCMLTCQCSWGQWTLIMVTTDSDMSVTMGHSSLGSIRLFGIMSMHTDMSVTMAPP